MGYTGERLWKIDLGVHYFGEQKDAKGRPKATPVPHMAGYWVEVLNPALLPYGKTKELYAGIPALESGASVGERMQRAELVREWRERFVTELVTAWNLTAVGDDSPVVLPLPKNDPTALDRAPDIVSSVFPEIIRLRDLAPDALPKGTATSSSAA
jgi:hypothetical protein